MASQFANGYQTGSVTIATGASLSDEEDLQGKTLCGVIIPSTWGTTADVTFAASDVTGGTFYPVRTPAGEYAFASITASQYLAVDPAVFAGVRFLKVRSGTSATPVNQTGGDVLTLVFRAL